MMLLQKQCCSTPLGLGRVRSCLAPRRPVAVRYREENKTETPRTWQQSPYYSDVGEDPAESLRNGFNKLKAKWDNWEPEKRNQTLAWGGGGLLVLYLANGLINQIDRLPLLPQFLQLVGFAFSSWFAFRYLLYAEGREDLSRLSLDKLLGKADDEAGEFTRSFGRAFAEGGEGIGEAGDRIRKSDAGRALKDAANSADGKLSDGSGGAYSDREVKSSIRSARRDLEDTLP